MAKLSAPPTVTAEDGFPPGWDIIMLSQRYQLKLSEELSRQYIVQAAHRSELELLPEHNTLINPKTGNEYLTVASPQWRQTRAEFGLGLAHLDEVIRMSIDHFLDRLCSRGFMPGMTITLLAEPKVWMEMRGGLFEGECYVDVEDTVGYLRCRKSSLKDMRRVRVPKELKEAV